MYLKFVYSPNIVYVYIERIQYQNKFTETTKMTNIKLLRLCSDLGEMT